ncbi:MAG: type III polyketide synthase [Planctomycetota bacterium]|jgi:predicted naringenin-chalcone synthase
MGLNVVGLGTAVPARSVNQRTSVAWSQEVLKESGERRRLIGPIFMRAGVNKRHSVLLEGSPPRQEFFLPAACARDGGPTTRERMEVYEREALPLALKAARRALRGRTDITHLVTATCSGFSAPGIDIKLIRNLGLADTVQRTLVGFMGCHGAFNALRVARGFVESDESARVLVCAVELCSLHYQYGVDAESIVANGLFADGAAALLADGEASDWNLVANGSVLLSGTEDLMSWEIGNHGFAMGLSGLVPDAIGSLLPAWLDGWLAEQGLTRESVASWAVHPGGPRILSAVERALCLPSDALDESRAVLGEFGNMSSPTILFVLERLMRAGAPRPCVALGFGPGLTAEAMLFR